MIDVYKIIPNTTVEGPGMRFCIWVQGCKKHCSGCWAKEVQCRQIIFSHRKRKTN